MEQTIKAFAVVFMIAYAITALNMWYKSVDRCGCPSCKDWPRYVYILLALVLTFTPFVIYDLQ